MQPVIRVNLNQILNNSDQVILELGSGKKKKPGRLLIDRIDMPHIDIITDLEKGLPFLPDNSVDEIHSKSLLEHIDNFDFLMKEIWRVLKPSGRNYLYVPHFSNPYYFSDYTHQRFFGLYSFEYFSKRQLNFKRKVPSFYNDYGFITEDIRLVFTSPWKVRKIFKRLFGTVINSNVWIMEFYEENLCYIIPCYALKVVLKPEKE